MKKTGKTWTTHDFDAAEDRGIVRLRAKYGWEGYGIYWRLVEHLGQVAAQNHTEQRDDVGIGIIAQLAGRNKKWAAQFLDYCINVAELFQANETHWWSDRLLREMAKYDQKADQRKQAASAGGRARIQGAQRHADGTLVGKSESQNNQPPHQPKNQPTASRPAGQAAGENPADNQPTEPAAAPAGAPTENQPHQNIRTSEHPPNGGGIPPAPFGAIFENASAEERETYAAQVFYLFANSEASKAKRLVLSPGIGTVEWPDFVANVVESDWTSTDWQAFIDIVNRCEFFEKWSPALRWLVQPKTRQRVIDGEYLHVRESRKRREKETSDRDADAEKFRGTYGSAT